METAMFSVFTYHEQTMERGLNSLADIYIFCIASFCQH